jgi:hypothetical protein
MIDVVKKMLFALRSGMFPREILPSFIAALRAVVKASFSTEVVRTLATFVTSFSQKGAAFGFPVLTSRKTLQDTTFQSSEFQFSGEKIGYVR